MPHLLVDISAHGYGHVGQTAPVVNELARCMPGLRVTVRSAAPAEVLQRHFQCEFRHIPASLDFGLKMVNAVDVQVEESAAAYRDYHADWDAKVQRAADEMQALQPDLLLADVPYLSLAAARAAGIRAAALSSLNWADIYQAYCAGDPASAGIHAQMLAAYNGAEVFLRVQPAMPMPDLRNTHSVGPVAQVGRNRRTELEARLPPLPPGLQMGRGAAAGHPSAHPLRVEGWGGGTLSTRGISEKLVLLAMGGIAYRLPMEHWPRLPGVRWLVPAAWNIAREDITAFESLGLPFGDVLASCDAVLTKPGYGTFVEAACAGVAVLYAARPDWPEEPYLAQWLQQHDVCREVGRERLENGDFGALLHELWAQPRPPAPVASGVEEAAEILAGML